MLHDAARTPDEDSPQVEQPLFWREAWTPRLGAVLLP
jgi:hypothetical protein